MEDGFLGFLFTAVIIIGVIVTAVISWNWVSPGDFLSFLFFLFVWSIMMGVVGLIGKGLILLIVAMFQ